MWDIVVLVLSVNFVSVVLSLLAAIVLSRSSSTRSSSSRSSSSSVCGSGTGSGRGSGTDSSSKTSGGGNSYPPVLVGAHPIYMVCRGIVWQEIPLGFLNPLGRVLAVLFLGLTKMKYPLALWSFTIASDVSFLFIVSFHISSMVISQCAV